LPILKEYDDDSHIAGLRAVGFRMFDNPADPLPLIPDPSGQVIKNFYIFVYILKTMLVEPYRLNMSFPEKYQYRSTKYSTFKVFVKVKEVRREF
jgi:hypothetical protein